jgi:hypothetical protein
MQDRRSDRRYRLTEPCEGTVRVFCNVIVHEHGEHEWIAISSEAAVVGETLILDVDQGELRRRVTVRVSESRPIVIEGETRYRIRLHDGELPPILFEQQVRRG